MKDTMSIEELLAAAGFSFTVVECCPDSACTVCKSTEVARAA